MRVVAVRDPVVDVAVVVERGSVPRAARRSLVTLGLVGGVEAPQLRAVAGVERENLTATRFRGFGEIDHAVAYGGLDGEPEVLTLGDPELACDDLPLPVLLARLRVE